MRLKYSHPHHILISEILDQFNANYLRENNIFFGGGTRIALELDEFRESVDIDFMCPSKQSYKAVRSQMTNASLGAVLKPEANLTFLRDVTADMYSVRAFVSLGGDPVKLEFVSFSNVPLTGEDDPRFAVPILDRRSCYLAKLLAQDNRQNDEPYKDIFDIVMMYKSWGDIPAEAIEEAEDMYGSNGAIVKSGVQRFKRLPADDLFLL